MLYFKRIFVGSRCQNACGHCAAQGRETPSNADIDAAIRQASAENLIFWGGEPLLRQDIVELVRLAAGRGGRRLKVRTNARALARGDLLNDLIEAGVYFFEVKVAGPDAPVHDEVCGCRGAFEETTAGLAAIRRVSELRGAEFSPYLECLVPVVAENLELLAVTLQTLLPFDPDRVHFELADSELPLLKVVPHVRAALENAVLGKVWATTLGLPLCLMTGFEPHVREALPGAASGRKLKPCKGCVLREVCPGVEAALVTRQGERQVEAQLSPLTSSRHLESLKLLHQPHKVSPAGGSEP